MGVGHYQRNGDGLYPRNTSGRYVRGTALNETCCCTSTECCEALEDAIAVSGITRSGSTATVTTSAAHGFITTVTYYIRIAGADQGEYNGAYAITVTGSNTFTYTLTGTPATPATGTITAQKVTPLGNFCADVRCAPNSFLVTISDLTICEGCKTHGIESHSVITSVPSGSYCVPYKAQTGPPSVLLWELDESGHSFGLYYFDVDCEDEGSSVPIDHLVIQVALNATLPSSGDGTLVVNINGINATHLVGRGFFTGSQTYAYDAARECRISTTLENDYDDCDDEDDDPGSIGGSVDIEPCCEEDI